MIKKKVNFWTIIKISKGKRIESKGGKYVGRKAFFFFLTLRLAMCFSPTHIIVLSHSILYFKINLKFNLMELGNKMIKLKQHI